MSKETPDHHDADLILKLYDLRRETVMRESRHTIAAKFWPKNYEEFGAITKPEHPHNAAFRQVSSYYEMAYGFARHGILHADLLAENSGEGLFLLAKVKPHLERFRKEMSPTAFQNAEWIATNSAAGRMRFEMFQKRVQKMHESK